MITVKTQRPANCRGQKCNQRPATTTTRLQSDLATIRDALVKLRDMPHTEGKWLHDTTRGTIGDVVTEDGDGIAQTQERIEIAREMRGNRIRQVEIRNRNAAYIAALHNASRALIETAIEDAEDALNGFEICHPDSFSDLLRRAKVLRKRFKHLL